MANFNVDTTGNLWIGTNVSDTFNTAQGQTATKFYVENDGTIKAEAGTIGGIDLAATHIQSSNYSNTSGSEAGFKIRTMQHTLCMAYIRGLIDMQSLLCQSAELIDEKDVSHWLKSFGTNFYAAEQLDAIVQSYVNHMTSHPEEWQDSPRTHLVETSLGLAPCK